MRHHTKKDSLSCPIGCRLFWEKMIRVIGAKEYCASNIFKNGVLILSEFAGAATQLHRQALLLNPYHLELAAEKIYQACHMTHSERKKRMGALRKEVKRSNIYWWVDSFLNAVFSMT